MSMILSAPAEATMEQRERRRTRGASPTTTRTAPEARAYAEAWFQCLREPQTHVQPVLTSSAPRGGTFVRDLDVGHWRTNGGQVYVDTPVGMRDERAIGRAVFEMGLSRRADDVLHSKLLGRVITGASMASLLDPRGGWMSPRERSIRYGLACLVLAVQLGDRDAEEPLQVLRRMLMD